MEQFFELIDFFPGFRALEITDGKNDITTPLAKKIQNSEGSLDIITFKNLLLPDNLPIKIRYLDSYEKDFRVNSREYELVVVNNILDKLSNPLKTLQNIYNSMETNSQIIILQKKETFSILKSFDLLQEVDFHSPNSVDLFEDVDVVVARKVLMWCGN